VGQLFTWTCTNQTISWLVCSCIILVAWTSHMHTWTHKTHNDLDLGEITTFPFLVFSVLGHGAYIQMLFCPETLKLKISKFPKLGLPQLWRPIFFCADFWLKWSMKKSFNLCRDLSNNMWHTTYTQANQGNYWLLMVVSQIGKLSPGLFFGHNLCFKYSNGTCKPLLDI